MKPIRANDPSISSVRSEICSAASSMNMEPEAIDNAPSNARYMTDLFHFANHAHDHCLMALDNLGVLRQGLVEIMLDLRRKGDWENYERLADIVR